MNITKEQIDNLNAILKINITPEDYTGKVDEAINDHRKKARIPGFRPGMVPASHIKKLYGKSILVEEINKLLSDSLNNYISENQIEVLGQPLPKIAPDEHYNWDFTETYEFMYELGIAPSFNAEISEKDTFTRYKVIADEETLESRLKNLRRSYGKMSNPEISEEGDVIYGEFKQLASDGTLFEGGIEVVNSLRMELIEDKAVMKSLIGLKKGDMVKIDVVQAFAGDVHRIAGLLKIDEESASQLRSSFELTVKNVNRLEESPLNQEFFDKIYGEGNVKTEEELKEKIRAELEGMMGENAERKLQVDMVEYYLSKFNLQLPDEFLKRWLRTINPATVTDQQIEEQYGDFSRNLQWTLIENRIIKDHQIEVKSEEVVKLAKQKIEAQFKMYSPTPITDEQLSEYAVNFLQDRERASKIVDEVRAHKVFEYLKNIVTLREQEIPYKEFLELK